MFIFLQIRDNKKYINESRTLLLHSSSLWYNPFNKRWERILFHWSWRYQSFTELLWSHSFVLSILLVIIHSNKQHYNRWLMIDEKHRTILWTDSWVSQNRRLDHSTTSFTWSSSTWSRFLCNSSTLWKENTGWIWSIHSVELLTFLSFSLPKYFNFEFFFKLDLFLIIHYQVLECFNIH